MVLPINPPANVPTPGNIAVPIAAPTFPPATRPANPPPAPIVACAKFCPPPNLPPKSNPVPNIANGPILPNLPNLPTPPPIVPPPLGDLGDILPGPIPPGPLGPRPLSLLRSNEPVRRLPNNQPPSLSLLDKALYVLRLSSIVFFNNSKVFFSYILLREDLLRIEVNKALEVLLVLVAIGNMFIYPKAA